MQKRINIFYAHSSHRESVLNVYDKIVDYFKNNDDVQIIDVDDTPTNNNIFLNCILDAMKMSKVCICDITPDFSPIEHLNKNEIDITPCINSNVMYELGFWECLQQQQNLVLIIDESICKSIPSMLRGHYILRYNRIEDINNIVDRINAVVSNLKESKVNN